MCKRTDGSTEAENAVASKATGTKAGRDFDKEQLSRSASLVNMVVQQNNGQSDRTQLFAEYFAYLRRWMETKDRALSIRAWNIGFSGLLCTGLGFLLLEKCSIEMGARPIVHITSTVVCALIAGATFRGAALQRPAASPAVENGPQKRGLPASAGNIVSAMLLACIGYAGAVALKGGWATNAAVLAVCLHLIPWSRIPLCSAGFLVPGGYSCSRPLRRWSPGAHCCSALACSRGMVSLDGVTMRLDDAYFPEEAETESAPVSARNATLGARMMSCRAEAA
jgi:hypothetical protein